MIFNEKRAGKGFTLIEAMVTVGLAVLVLTIAYSAFMYGGRTSAQTRVDVLREQEILKLFHQVRFQLINLYQASGDCLIGESGTRPRESELYFLTTSLRGSDGVGEVGYRIMEDPDTGRIFFGYTEFPYPRQKERFAINNINSEYDKWRPVSEVVKGFTVEYEKNSEWVKEWRESSPPKMVRVTFWYQDEEPVENENLKSDRAEFRSTVREVYTDGENTDLVPYRFPVVPGVKYLED